MRKNAKVKQRSQSIKKIQKTFFSTNFDTTFHKRML